MTGTFFKRPFRLIGIVFLGGAGLLLMLGAWTFAFSEVKGKVISLENTGMMMSGGYSGIPRVRNRPSQTTSVAVSYSYRVQGKRVKGSRIGMGLAPWTLSPLGPMRWERYAEPGSAVTVYHTPNWPSVSVLHRGPDVVSIAVLILVGIALIRFSAWLERHERPQQDPAR